MIKNYVLCLLLAVVLVVSPQFVMAQDYNPLQSVVTGKAQSIGLTVTDTPRQRDIPVRIYLAATPSPQPVILFSHGLGGNREGSAYLGQHWASRGYIAVFMQHQGSDSSLWKDKNKLKALVEMKRAMSGENLNLRIGDVKAVIDQLDVWSRTQGSPLFNKIDMAHIGMSGHSFGAVTTQAVSGQKRSEKSQDDRIKAAVIMSPSKPRLGTSKQAFGSVATPWLLMTGTKDSGGISGLSLDDRLAVYEALPTGDKYQIVLAGAEHSAFGDREIAGDKGQRNPNHHRVIQALSTAFWDAYLRKDQAALQWLQHGGAEGLLEPDDVWQKK